uniref:protein O-GlcNAc transferase n=1 Tax=viral metagenome TaxID=1070528 RepID=A0A6C0H6Q1_9ZZZZ
MKQEITDRQQSKADLAKSYRKTIERSQQYIAKSIEATSPKRTDEFRRLAIAELDAMLQPLDITDYLLLDSNPPVPKREYIESYFNLGTLYKTCAEAKMSSPNTVNEAQNMFDQALRCFVIILRVQFEDELAKQQMVSIYTQLCYLYQNDMQMCLRYLHEALLYAPENETIHYNLGFVYQKMNRLELSLIHYKLSLELIDLHITKNNSRKEELRKLTLNNYNGLSCIYRSIKQWPEALHYLLKGEKVDSLDPDVQNQLGVVYTEMRRTDLAERSYEKAIKNYKRSFISSDHQFLLSEIYLNYGHMHSYNGDNAGAIEKYNQSLKVSPKFTLPFQNKIMNLSYLFDQLEDKKYILNQHTLVNKLYQKGNGRYQFTDSFDHTEKINIGIISGDFVDHPVSFFISTFLKNFDTTRFNVTCYSECIIDTSLFNPQLKFTFIKHHTATAAADIIYKDNIHILFDLAGHTAYNRLDVFALKPAPIQITYIGYPYSTGLSEMDYRITDGVCDNDSVSQVFYTEKLLYLPNCFLCYDPTVIKRTSAGQVFDKKNIPKPVLGSQPYLKNGYLTIGCYNRVNKMTSSVVKVFNELLLKFPTIRFVFKTKALLNQQIKKKFVQQFDTTVRSRIQVVDCTILHEDHLLEYNRVDLAIDTFPYSGTTTSCEALFMGVPVFTFYDKEYYFHPQNVTASILKNSGTELEYYIVNNKDELYTKIEHLMTHEQSFWQQLKQKTRTLFTNGKVCDKATYMNNIQTLLGDLYDSTKKLTI